ncbi:Nuclease HARBI1, partial [Phytophthora megakarya]
LSRQQEYYNYIHSATRMAIECAFGMLKQRFRLVRRQLEQKSSTNCTRCILAAMVLHNLFIDLQDDTISLNERDAPRDIVLEMEPITDRRDICRTKRKYVATTLPSS